MQVFAKNQRGEWVAAKEAQRGEAYRCPECDGEVRLRGGQERRSHFYHPRRNEGCRLGGKSALHFEAQLEIAAALPGAQLEAPLGNRIADVHWPEKNWVIEVQCSPITPSEVLDRMVDYRAAGKEVFWVLSDRRFRPHKPHPVKRVLADKPPIFLSQEGEIYLDTPEGRRSVDWSQLQTSRSRRRPLHRRLLDALLVAFIDR